MTGAYFRMQLVIRVDSSIDICILAAFGILLITAVCALTDWMKMRNSFIWSMSDPGYPRLFGPDDVAETWLVSTGGGSEDWALCFLVVWTLSPTCPLKSLPQIGYAIDPASILGMIDFDRLFVRWLFRVANVCPRIPRFRVECPKKD